MKLFFTSIGVCLAALLLAGHAVAQTPSLGIFDGNGGIGTARKSGSAAYNPNTRQYSLSSLGAAGAGAHFLWKRLKGDFILYARVRSAGKNAGFGQQAGWTIRHTPDSQSAHISAVVAEDGQASLQFRRTSGADTDEIRSKLTHADVIQLERKGSTYTMRVATFGQPFVTEQITDLSLPNDLYVGLFVGSTTPNRAGQAVFEDVRISTPAPDTLVAYRQYLGSNLEILDVTTGRRQTVYTSPQSLQAPNWTPDGKRLIYNSEGLIYTFDLAKGQPAVLNTGDVKNNNNDHVLSFDGQLLGLSSGVPALGGSIIYTVPIGGGQPKQITPKGPSYLHGWSPDGRQLVFTGQRNQEFDIYRISADGGPEQRLTDAKGLDDGPEYTPDGQWIYFNSARTGTMQIWRMKPDGSQQEAVTNGDFHDWFPHISPDGQWIVFLSFLKEEVEADQHPFYKHVYLRLLPISGKGKPNVIAYLYGGQGTINTPSWAPDSKRLAFISNSGSSTLNPVEK